MDSFEEFLDHATGKASNIIPGAVVAVVDQHGNYVYKKVSGTNGILEDAQPLEFDQTFYVASCTKLIASIAALQLVEKELITLDEPLDQLLSELSSQPIVSQTGDGNLKYDQATKSITLRDLVTHSSGATYDWIDPTMHGWRASRGEVPSLVLDGDVLKGHTYPRRYESGSSWNYSGGLDWTSLLTERLTGLDFEEYVEEKIAKPLGITTFTWHLLRKPNVAEKLARMSTRQENGILADGPNPFAPEPVKEAGGIGLYANVHDYTRVLADLLKDAPKLLTKSSVDQMFAPQLAPGSSAIRTLRANGSMYQCALDDSVEGVVANYGLGGLLMEEDVKRDNYFRPAGTLSWSGLPNLSWGINRERGLATFFATQVLPWADRKTWDVVARFETAVWTNLSA
ncbi:beta-lactamase/transpeptidase-like protein [Boeremia exigua]|uniref:beta-lactamase/transpeptidase-like protein n=1 Tax=Boeremia exigua TaxID=749465 RepID=UPI001E8EB0CF|nr:beta-lactamase/transpeptidase-like protein [Boeremia exigua]KAH6643607.1 beta-lactamase/transpeptidase-like protein [Boeremia exigua]